MPPSLFPSVFPIACDICTDAIRDADQGVLVWRSDAETGRTISITTAHHAGHKPECCPPDQEGVLIDVTPLWEVTDVGGLIWLCNQLKEKPDSAVLQAEIIQRLFVPGYDRIRFLHESH